jgi:hypothetical protein
MKQLIRHLAVPLTVAILFSFIITGCKNSGQPGETASSPGHALYTKNSAAESRQDGFMEAGDEARPAPSMPRKVITNYFLTLEVKDLAAAFDTVTAMVKKHGGYTTETNRSKNPDGSHTGRFVIRVPQAGTGGLLEMLRGIGTATAENSTGEDITEDYVDLEARLKNMKASEARLRELLSRQTTKLADILAVEKELTRVRGEIEAFEARKRSWDTLTSFVTINVELTEPRGAFPVLYKIWNPIRTAFGDALEGFAGSLHSAVVFLGIVLPWAIPFGILVYLGKKYFRKGQAVGKTS